MKKELLREFEVPIGKRVRLKDYDPGWVGTGEMKALGKDVLKQNAQEFLASELTELSTAQDLLWASNTHSVLLILQAIDAAGKDGTIKHVMSGLNPQGCRVVSFKRPSEEELDHSFLWRVWKQVPAKGEICVFNRSHYEDVLVVRVHPELLDAAKLPPGDRGEKFWQQRYDDINAFEHHLARNGTTIVKVFLNLSKAEQKRRFMERLSNPAKHWKFEAGDLRERAHWDDYQRAFEAAIEATNTKWAPWYVVPADHKWVSRAAVAGILTRAIKSLDLQYPKVTGAKLAELESSRRALEAEE